MCWKGLILTSLNLTLLSKYKKVAHGEIQFTAYEELRKLIIDFRHKQVPSKEKSSKLLTAIDFATLGAASKLTAILATYPFQVIRSRLQQQPTKDAALRKGKK